MDHHELAARVARLEKQNRRLRRYALAAALLVAGCVTMGQATTETEGVPESLKTQSLQILDAEGRSRVLLAAEEGGPAALVVTDSTGRTRAMIGVDPDDTPVMKLSDSLGRLRVQVRVDPEGDPIVKLYDRGENLRLRIATVDGQPGLAMLDRNGGDSVELASLDGGEAGLVLHGETRALLGVFGTKELVKLLTGLDGKSSGAQLAVCTAEGKVIRRLP